jgi:hypothetical protein
VIRKVFRYTLEGKTIKGKTIDPADAVSRSGMEEMLIDEFMPEYEFVERHRVDIAAPVEPVYAAVVALDFSDSKIIRWLFLLRGLPALTRFAHEIIAHNQHALVDGPNGSCSSQRRPQTVSAKSLSDGG